MTPAKPRIKPRALECPNCGSAVALRGMTHSLNAVCPNCMSVLDVQHEQVQILQKYGGKTAYATPLVPLGSRGKFEGAQFEAIGFQVRRIVVDGTPYEWREYLLFNPYKGFRYLSEYDGHWNIIRTVPGMPTFGNIDGRKSALWQGEGFKHFQHAQAVTVFVLGEFPFQVRNGDQATVDDYIAPPKVLSSEIIPGEINWSIGEYRTGAEIWQAFQLPGSPPAAQGVYANQPAPPEMKTSAWSALGTAVVLEAILFVVLVGSMLFMGNENVFKQSYYFRANAPGEQSFVTPVFELKGRPTNVEIDLETNLRQNWAYFSMALINEQTGQAWDFGREVSYYSGSDWSEGSSTDSVRVPTVPAGRYYLRMEPEMDPKPMDVYTSGPREMTYTVTIKRDVPALWPILLAMLLVPIPALFRFGKKASFESLRWAESDYGSATGSGDDEDE
ncbi:MAG: DUF4178 domain-containing protein [Bryobacterales bacterium]|nr:DUF4178 domain-containing protein [Bryobacterales bacterium]